MKAVTVVLLLALLFCVAVEVADAYFGCPLNQHRCHVHCLAANCKGGYCGGWFRLKCRCIGC
uniref:Defensin n=1 Tax=Mytilus galloprovincialis TaxID=29158 RepID=H9AXM9_MYTGA|nr:defensin [Mytilus galloprovincialis]